MKEPHLYHGTKEFGEEGFIRFCMPGHKGKKTGSFLDSVFPYDSTELFSTDNLQKPEGMIKKAEETAAEIYKSRFSCFSANGASPLVKAAVYLAAKGGRILAGRESHISLVHGAVLSGTEIIWLYGGISELGIPLPPSPEETEKKLKNNADINAVFITSPNYFGVMADIPGLSEVCKRYHIPFIVDNSHGSHLIFLEEGKKHPNLLGGEIVIDSAHKTLPALTGASLLHINTLNYTKEEVKDAILLFSSTSPSYLIMSSLDVSICYSDQNRNGYEIAAQNGKRIRDVLKEKGFICLNGENVDPLRLTIITAAAGIDSNEANKRLFEKRIACEMADGNSLVLILSPADTMSELLLVANELDLLYNERGSIETNPKKVFLPQLKTILPVRDAFFSPKETISINEAEGRVCGECITAYPPCVPLAVTGEYITKEFLSAIKEFAPREKIIVVKEEHI